MLVLDALKQSINAAADVIKWGAGIQETARKDLVTKLQAICSNIEAAYDAVLTRLVSVKNAYNDPAALGKELRSFAADPATRSQFKPDHLCGDVDVLMTQLSNNLDPLKYSVDFRRIRELRNYLLQFSNVDAAILHDYDEFTRQLDDLATQIQDAHADLQERTLYVRHVVESFTDELRSVQTEMRAAKAKVVGLI